MNTKQILAKHIANKRLKVSLNEFIKLIEEALKDPKMQILRSGDSLFLIYPNEDTLLVHSINDSDTEEYIQSLKSFKTLVKQLGYTYISMNVKNVNAAKKIVSAAGFRNIAVQDSMQEDDVKIMTAEV